jgi:tRNA (guanine-N7-)-methyltransferase
MTEQRIHPPHSFRRRGRVTTGQRRALDTLWSRFGLDLPEPLQGHLDLTTTFGRSAPVALEIGFGRGEATLAMAAADPARDVLAVDVHRPGAGGLLGSLEAAGLTNVRVAVTDARTLLDRVARECLDEVRVFFPDPWPKTRQHKRRLLDPETVRVLARRLRVGGLLHVATDWAPYAEQILAVIAAEPLLQNSCDGFAPRPPGRPITHYEARGLARGHVVRDILAHRVADGPHRVADRPAPASPIAGRSDPAPVGPIRRR